MQIVQKLIQHNWVSIDARNNGTKVRGPLNSQSFSLHFIMTSLPLLVSSHSHRMTCNSKDLIIATKVREEMKQSLNFQDDSSPSGHSSGYNWPFTSFVFARKKNVSARSFLCAAQNHQEKVKSSNRVIIWRLNSCYKLLRWRLLVLLFDLKYFERNLLASGVTEDGKRRKALCEIFQRIKHMHSHETHCTISGTQCTTHLIKNISQKV